MNLNNHYSSSFRGTTKIYAISDSHQETRKTSAFLSKILDESKRNKNVLFLNCGDIFKGIYPKTMERDCYLKLKEANPDIEMVMTLGNNDFGFNKDGLDYLIDTVKTFSDKGIKTVCANIFDKDGNRPDWLKPYTIIERDGDRTFVTGFCIDNINTAKYGIIPKKQDEVLDEICENIKQEKPDNVVILNHDYMPVSKEIIEKCKKNGVDVDIIIGGHDHEFVQPDRALNIYYPQSFCDSMYQMNITNSHGKKTVNNVKMVKNEGLEIKPEFENELNDYEEKTGLLDDIAPYTLNLTKFYSKPCSLGSFLADAMKDSAKSDIAFFSTGFLMKPMLYKPDKNITNYEFQKTMIADTPIKTVNLSAKELKEVFQHSLEKNGYGSSNPKFLQCSNNIKLQGKDNPKENRWDLKQIYINDEPILDNNGNPLNDKKTFSCAIDSYIAEGGQGFSTIQQKDKQNVLIDNKPIKINEVLRNALQSAPNKYEKGSDYPEFVIDGI